MTNANMLSPSPEPSPPCSPLGKRKAVELEEEHDEDADSSGPTDATRAPKLYHFKALYDQLWDYPKICKKFFLSEHPYLCVKEHAMTNSHVHFQGYSMCEESSFRKKMSTLGKTHYLKDENPHCRPCSMAKRTVNDVGFQYMCKEIKTPLAVNMFTPEDLVDMKTRSTMLVKEMKTCLIEYIKSIPYPELDHYLKRANNGNELIQYCTYVLVNHQQDGKLTLPDYNARHTRTSIIRGLLALPQLPLKQKAMLYCL